MGNLATKLEAMLRGGASGATAGWNEEGVAKLLSSLPMPKDPEGIERNYAAGSAEQDYRNTERNDANELERRFPGSFKSGKMLGAFPSLGIGGAGGVARAGLMGGARGALSGAGNATEGNRLEGAAKLAGPEAAASMLGAAAPAAVGKLKDLFGNLPPPGGLAPAFAGAGAGIGGAAAEEGLPFINMMSTIPAKGGGAGRVRLSPDERIIRQDQDEWAMRNPAAAQQETNVGKPAVPPPAPSSPEAAYVPDIPKSTKAWPTSLDKAFDEVNKVERAGAKEAAAREKLFQELERGRDAGDYPPLLNEADPRQNPQLAHKLLREDPTWAEMEAQISKQNNPPSGGGTRPVNIPKTPKLPDLQKEYDAANAEYKLNDDFDKLKAKGKGTVEKTKQIATPSGPGVERQVLKVAPGKVEADEENMRTLLGTVPL